MCVRQGTENKAIRAVKCRAFGPGSTSLRWFETEQMYNADKGTRCTRK